jgi:hypothetical protein
VFRPGADGVLAVAPRIRVGRHPSALLLNSGGSRLFVASASTDRVSVVDTKQGRVLTEILDSPPGGPGEGSTPNALALSADGTRLYVAEADNNAIAIVDLAAVTSDVSTATGSDRVTGRIPAQWYPTAVIARGDSLIALSGKGHGTGPNRGGPGPGRYRTSPGFDVAQYTLGQTSGTVLTSQLARVKEAELDALSQAADWPQTAEDLSAATIDAACGRSYRWKHSRRTGASHRRGSSRGCSAIRACAFGNPPRGVEHDRRPCARSRAERTPKRQSHTDATSPSNRCM